MLDMARTREVFEASTDFTLAVEEEFQLLDPETLDLTQRYTELRALADQDPILADAVAGELIESEIEIRSGRAETWAEMVASQREARERLFRVAADSGITLGATGTHPWSPWQEQKIIDTEHYRRVAEGLQYVAWRNNTFGIHVHVGIHGADRAIAVCDRLRMRMPELLAVSANSPFLDGRDSGLHSARTQIFTKSFPRCGIPDAFGDWASYANYVDFLTGTNSIVEHTQLWWSVRPHHAYGTVEVRICDAQSSAEESTALAGLAAACAAQSALDHDDGLLPDPPPGRLIEENFWRAIRYGLDGKMIDLQRGEEFPAAALADRLMGWTAPARAAMGGVEPALPEQNGAQRQRAALAGGASMQEVYEAEVAAAQRSYAGERVKT
jgi:carboxylate-amine ligase